jgi:peptide/nickel transport system substrate-binding protein
MKKISRRDFLKVSAASLAAVTLAGCATETPKPAATTAPAATMAPTAKPGPAKGGTAVVAIDADPDTLNLGLSTAYSVGDVCAKIYNALIWIDKDFNIKPSLAEKWDISSDALTYTFKLRSGVTWHDGKPFSSADVKYTFEEILGKFHPRSTALIKRMKSIEAPDANTLVITLTAPYAPLLLQLNVFEAPILAKHVYDGQGDVTKNPANIKPVGTGPFKFVEWTKGATIKLARNESYWEKDKPYLDAIVFSVIPQAANRSTALETGEADYLVNFYVPLTDAKRLSSNTKLVTERGHSFPAVYFMMMNTATKLLSTKEARQALAFAIDRNRIITQANDGIGRAARGPFGDGFPWLLNPDVDYAKMYPRDVAKAKSLLDTAGLTAGADGSRGKLRLLVSSARAPFVTAAQIIKENLKEVGIEVEISSLENSVMLQKVFTDREYDLTLQSFVSSGDPAIGYHRIYVTTKAGTNNTNATGYSNTKVDELLTKAASTPDQKSRADAYKELQTILAADLPTLVLYDDDPINFASKKLNGLWATIDTREKWEDVWLTK